MAQYDGSGKVRVLFNTTFVLLRMVKLNLNGIRNGMNNESSSVIDVIETKWTLMKHIHEKSISTKNHTNVKEVYCNVYQKSHKRIYKSTKALHFN